MARVRYFAAAEDAAGAEQEERSEATIGALRAALIVDHPDLAAILPRCAVLLEGARVPDETALADDATVDILPPFAGG